MADVADVTDAVHVLDDDSSSVASYSVPPPPPPPRNWIDLKYPKFVPKEQLKVDGKTPDVIHSLEYIGWRNTTVAFRQSVNPFKTIPDLQSLQDGKKPAEDKEEKSIERPVIEILTKVYSLRSLPRPLQHGRGVRNQSGRPITSAFELEPGPYDGYYSDEDYRPAAPDSSNPDVNDPVMVVWSAHLQNALKAVVGYYPNFQLVGPSPHIPAPYRVLYHHRAELARYRDNQPTCHSPEYAAITAKHIDVLLRFLNVENGTEIRREEELHRLETPMATFDYFWLLLRPGTIVFAKRYDIWTPYLISSADRTQQRYRTEDEYRINVWNLESNGTKVERFMESFTVAPWLGEQAISSLPVVPAQFWKEDLEKQGGVSMRAKAIAEGKLYWELLKGPRYMEYDGLLVNSSAGNRNASGPTGFMSGRVICDASGFDKYLNQAPDMAQPMTGTRRNRPSQPLLPPKDHLPRSLPRCGCEVCVENRPEVASPSQYVGFEDLDPQKDMPPPNSDLFYTLLSKTIPGFILGSRRWGHLHVQNLKDVKSDKEAFKSLVIDEEIKLTVKALIGRFATGSEAGISPWGNDFIKNKGEGRIFLLHGEPGVGKTCTAECIAELTGRPLIALTAGDISVDAFRVEQNLNYFLELGQRYGALVLLDEADVYLERRRSKDIARNGLVSVFLRALEYYSGCIVISTNRVRSFDAAFMSRIHVALHYQNLRDEDRELIWANNFDRLDRDSAGRVHVSVAAREYVWNSSDVRSLRWNGREIRNAMQTALALAENEAREDGLERTTLSEKHIRAVVKMSRSFKDYISRSSPQGVQGYDGDGDDAYEEEDEDGEGDDDE